MNLASLEQDLTMLRIINEVRSKDSIMTGFNVGRTNFEARFENEISNEELKTLYRAPRQGVAGICIDDSQTFNDGTWTLTAVTYFHSGLRNKDCGKPLQVTGPAVLHPSKGSTELAGFVSYLKKLAPCVPYINLIRFQNFEMECQLARFFMNVPQVRLESNVIQSLRDNFVTSAEMTETTFRDLCSSVFGRDGLKGISDITEFEEARMALVKEWSKMEKEMDVSFANDFNAAALFLRDELFNTTLADNSIWHQGQRLCDKYEKLVPGDEAKNVVQKANTYLIAVYIEEEKIRSFAFCNANPMYELHGGYKKLKERSRSNWEKHSNATKIALYTKVLFPPEAKRKTYTETTSRDLEIPGNAATKRKIGAKGRNKGDKTTSFRR